MPRVLWILVAVVLMLAGWDLLLTKLLGVLAYIVLGIGIGIGTAVVGSLAYDSLAGPRERL